MGSLYLKDLDIEPSFLLYSEAGWGDSYFRLCLHFANAMYFCLYPDFTTGKSYGIWNEGQGYYKTAYFGAFC